MDGKGDTMGSNWVEKSVNLEKGFSLSEHIQNQPQLRQRPLKKKAL